MTEKPERRKQDAAQTPADDPLIGTWIREETDESPYPDELTFAADGIYRGTMAPGSREASKLDVGVFDRIDDTSIRMSTATDRDETFSLDTSADRLKLTDEDGKEFSYTRSSAAATAPPSASDAAGSKAAPTPDAGTDGPPEAEWTP